MPVFRLGNTEAGQTARSAEQPHIVVGVTSPQAWLVLGGRLRALREAGFRITLVSGPGDLLAGMAASQNVDAVALPIRREIAPFADLVSLVRLYRLLRRLKPDVVEFGTPKAGLLGTLAARFCGVPVRVYMLRGLRLETASGLKRRILLATERLACGSAHVVLCNSESLRSVAAKLGLAPAEKLHLLGVGSSHGVDVERFGPGPSDVRERLGIGRDASVVGFVGRLTRDKGLPELVEAFDTIQAAEPRTHLLLVGWFDASEDAVGEELRARIGRNQRIHTTGFVADTAPYYRAMDMMVLPTWREGFPNVVLEAAATGIPVVTTESTGSRDSVVPEVTGLLIPPGYPDAISEAVLKLLRDSGRRHRMGEAARAWAVEHYLDERVIRLAAEFYRGLLDRKIAGDGGRRA